jgi:hypothetical protein
MSGELAVELVEHDPGLDDAAPALGVDRRQPVAVL